MSGKPHYLNPFESRPDVDMAACVERKNTVGLAVGDTENTLLLRQPNALTAPAKAVPEKVVAPAPLLAAVKMKPEVVGNVISLAAHKVAKEQTEQMQADIDQDLRRANARLDVAAAHQPAAQLPETRQDIRNEFAA